MGMFTQESGARRARQERGGGTHRRVDRSLLAESSSSSSEMGRTSLAILPFGPADANQDTWLTPRVLEMALSCRLQAPAEHISSCWSGLWGRSGSLWIQMCPPSLWATASPPFFWGLPPSSTWQNLPFPSVGSLAPSCWSLLLLRPVPSSWAASPAGTRVPPGRVCGCPECIRPAEHQTPIPESESPGTSVGICIPSRYHPSVSSPHEVPRGCVEWTKKSARKKERHAIAPGSEAPGNASPHVLLLFSWVLSSPDLILIHHGVIDEAILLKKKNERVLTMIIAVNITPDIGLLTDECGKFPSETT